MPWDDDLGKAFGYCPTGYTIIRRQLCDVTTQHNAARSVYPLNLLISGDRFVTTALITRWGRRRQTDATDAIHTHTYNVRPILHRLSNVPKAQRATQFRIIEVDYKVYNKTTIVVNVILLHDYIPSQCTIRILLHTYGTRGYVGEVRCGPVVRCDISTYRELGCFVVVSNSCY